MTADHDCQLDWCQARACDCPYSSAQPHARANCRYANDDQEEAEQ